jgi:hypothetical protein
MIANPQTGTMESISSGQFAIERKMRTAKEIQSDIIRQGKGRELGPVAVWEQGPIGHATVRPIVFVALLPGSSEPFDGCDVDRNYWR